MSSTIGVSEPVRAYVQKHGVREHPVLRRCREETLTHPRARMQISPEQGAFLRTLVFATGARRILEIGVFTGYSSLAFALALRDLHGAEGQLVACDVSEEFLGIARRHWEEAAVADLVEPRLGAAADTLEALLVTRGEGAFDLAFVDADKTGYPGYYEQCVRLLRPRGVLLIDNMLWAGAVADETDLSPDTRALRLLAATIHADERVEMTLATIGDGLSVVVKKLPVGKLPISRPKNVVSVAFEKVADRATRAAGSAGAFSFAAFVILVWAASGPFFKFSETWQLVINTGTTIVTFLMVFLIQKTQNKESMAMQIKLNELIASSKSASNRLVDIESLTEDELMLLHGHYAKLAEETKRRRKLRHSHSIEGAVERSSEKLGDVADPPAGRDKDETPT